MVTAAMKLKNACSLEGKLWQCIKKQRYHFANKGLFSQSYGFSSSHVWICELDHQEGWVPKKWCFLIAVLEKTPENPLDCKEFKPVNPKRNQPWIFFIMIGAEPEAPKYFCYLLQLDSSLEKTDAGKDWGQEGRRGRQDEMVEWHYSLNGCVWTNPNR